MTYPIRQYRWLIRSDSTDLASSIRQWRRLSRSESKCLAHPIRQQRWLIRSDSADLASSIRQRRWLFWSERECLAHSIKQWTQLSRSESNILARWIKQIRHDLSNQTVNVTFPIIKCRFDFFEQTEAWLFRSDRKDMALPIRHQTLDFTHCQCLIWRKILPI